MDPSSSDPKDEAEWRAFGLELRVLRKARGLTQKEVAAPLGVVPSWVSQVESAQFAPSPERAEALAQMLGGELRVLVPSHGSSDVAAESESAGFACLWRARADLLARAANVATPRSKRVRLDLLSRELLSSASAHPKAQAFLREGRLASLPEISQRTPLMTRRLVAVEVAAMKLDAPFEVRLDRPSILEQLDYILEDLGDDLGSPEEVKTSIAKTMRGLPPALRRPNWQDLGCVGGARGTVEALGAGKESGLSLLLAHDPVGWLGFEFAAGTWLVRPAVPSHAEGAGLPGASGPSAKLENHEPDFVFVTPTNVAIAQTKVRPSVGMLVGSTLLGPVLGAAVGLALGGLAGAAMTSRNQSREQEVSTAGAGVGRPPQVAWAPNRTLELAEAFGRQWVRVELTKVLALYSAFPELELAEVATGQLPTRDDARAHLLATSRLTASELEAEREFSDTTDENDNNRLRELAAIRDSLAAAAKALA